jgi:hypothetical protein
VYEFFHLYVVQPSILYSMLDYNLHLIDHNIISLKYEKILARAWHGYPY